LGVFLNKLNRFFNVLCDQLECENASQLYSKLGGKDALEIGLRQFQIICAGKAKPTVGLLLTLLRNIKPDFYKEAIIAFFESLSDPTKDKEILTYLNDSLRPSTSPPIKKQWLATKNELFYSESQLNFLKSNPEALRLHQRVLFYESVELNFNEKNVASELEKYGLVKIIENKLVCTGTSFRIPTELNSPPRITRLSSEYIVECLRNFLSFEGSTNQKFDMVTQFVSKKNADYIFNELMGLKEYIRSLGQAEQSDDSIPIIYIGFSKLLLKGELK